MSALKLFDPEHLPRLANCHTTNSTPDVIPFRPSATARVAWRETAQRRRQQSPLIARMRVIHENRQCPCCESTAVLPIELRDGLLNRSQRMIPGTGTLVGFRCDLCHHEWPVQG